MHALFTDSTILITGASSGIGAAFADELAPTGARLVLTGRDTARLDAVAARASRLGATVVTIPADLAAPGGVATLLGRLDHATIAVDHLVNNAGAGIAGRGVATPFAAQLGVIDLNVRASTELALRLLPGMVARHRGGILNVASLAAFQGMPRLSVYAGTKAYLLTWSEALHHELRGTGVRCSCLCPGPVDTRFFDSAAMDSPPPYYATQSAASAARAGLRAYAKDASHATSGLLPGLIAWLAQISPRRLNVRVAAAYTRPRADA